MRKILLQIVNTLFMSLTGLIAGTIVLYFGFGIVYLSIVGKHPDMTGEECARGNALAWLSIFAGSITGGLGGAYASLRLSQRDTMRTRADST